jgi:hypothetical protein
MMEKSKESADRIRTLLERNLQEVFGESDSRRRRAAIDELWKEDGVLYVPPGMIIGREAIDRFAGELRATHPEFAYTAIGTPQVIQNAGRLGWGSGPRGEAFDYRGWDVLIAEGGLIAALYVFLDEREFARSAT